MRYGLKWLGLVAATVVMVPLTEIPGFFEEPRDLIPAAVAKSAEDRKAEADQLRQQGIQLFDGGQIWEAMQLWEQALSIYQDLRDRGGEGRALRALGNGYLSLGDYRQAIDFYEQYLAIAREIGDRVGEGVALGNLGLAYFSLGDSRQAISFYHQSLAIAREIGNRHGEGNVLGNLGLAYGTQGEYLQAIDFFEHSLIIARDIGDRRGEAGALRNLGIAHHSLGEYHNAINQFVHSLAIARDIGDRHGEEANLTSLGNAHFSLGDYLQAVEFFDESLEIARKIGDRHREENALANLGFAHLILEEYHDAIHFFEQSVAIAHAIRGRRGEGGALTNLGNAYLGLEKYHDAILFFEQSLAIAHEIGDKSGEEAALISLGNTHHSLGKYHEAIEFYEKSLSIARQIGDRSVEGVSFTGFGSVQDSLTDHHRTILFYNQPVSIFNRVSNVSAQGSILANLGLAHHSLEEYNLALSLYHQALLIFSELDSRAEESIVLFIIGSLLHTQNQPELAITLLKASVNVRESIRDDLRRLDTALQQSFTDTVADDYRLLADLLLQQNRVPEAQRVLDLLRVQELDDYLDGVRRTAQTEGGIDLRDPEQGITERLLGGYELAQLRDIHPSQLSDDQIQRLTQLDADQRAMNNDFLTFIRTDPEIQALVQALDASQREQDLLARAEEFVNLQNNLRALEQNAVLIYPLILADRLELVLVTSFSAPVRYPVAVGSAELNAAIVAFRQALDDPSSDPRPIAQQLYQWLIAPMASDLQAIGAETLLYAPDGTLRYVPLAALHDDDQWLVEQYRINHITAASLQNFTLRPSATPSILAAAFSEGAFEFEVGQRSFAFGGLPFAGVEVTNLAAAFPDTTKFMNDRFSRTLVEPLMDSHTVVHLATHAAFVSGSPADSFILFGNGDRLTLAEIRDTWRGRFNNVELMVLSACETGVGDELGTGEEILGFGYLMKTAGVPAAIASLWAVSDGGTQMLMDAFYANLNQQMGKAEALRQAQIALITGDLTASGIDRRAGVEVISTQTGLPLTVADRLSHPYYWAPFILIGNGL